MNDTPNRATRRKKGYRQQVRPIRVDVPTAQAIAKGVKHGDRFVIPGKRLVAGQLIDCPTGQETVFLANVVQPPEGAPHGDVRTTESDGLPSAERDGSSADERDQGARPKD